MGLKQILKSIFGILPKNVFENLFQDKDTVTIQLKKNAKKITIIVDGEEIGDLNDIKNEVK